jgi:hypothetical protein
LPELTPDQYTELLRKLDDVCEQAQDLSRQIRAQMVTHMRRDQQMVSSGGHDRRQTPRNRRSGERRKSQRP